MKKFRLVLLIVLLLIVVVGAFSILSKVGSVNNAQLSLSDRFLNGLGLRGPREGSPDSEWENYSLYSKDYNLSFNYGAMQEMRAAWSTFSNQQGFEQFAEPGQEHQIHYFAPLKVNVFIENQMPTNDSPASAGEINVFDYMFKIPEGEFLLATSRMEVLEPEQEVNITIYVDGEYVDKTAGGLQEVVSNALIRRLFYSSWQVGDRAYPSSELVTYLKDFAYSDATTAIRTN